MVIFGIVLVALSLVGLGWFVGVTIERHIEQTSVWVRTMENAGEQSN